MENERQWDTKDHDILVELKTMFKGMVDDFRAYRGESHKAIAVLEAKYTELEKMKVSLIDFVKHTEADNIRITKLERMQWMALGVVAVLQFLAPYIIGKLF